MHIFVTHTFTSVPSFFASLLKNTGCLLTTLEGILSNCEVFFFFPKKHARKVIWQEITTTNMHQNVWSSNQTIKQKNVFIYSYPVAAWSWAESVQTSYGPEWCSWGHSPRWHCWHVISQDIYLIPPSLVFPGGVYLLYIVMCFGPRGCLSAGRGYVLTPTPMSLCVLRNI